MGLDTSGNAMWEEVQAAEEVSRKVFHSWDEMIQRYHGPHYERGAAKGGSDPVNPAFEMIAATSAQINAGDPECDIVPTRQDRPDIEQRALALQHALNRLARVGGMKRNLKKLFIDWYFRRCCTYLVRTRAPWMDRGPLDGPVMRPESRRVPPKSLRYDARAMDWDDTRWRGHELVVSKSAVLERAKTEKGWRVKEIERIEGEVGIQELMPAEGKRVTRDDFKLLIVWVPEEQVDADLGPEEGFHGTQHFYACSTRRSSDSAQRGALIEIRDPQPWYGPRRGPYNRSGMYYVPDKVEPLSVSVAIEHVARSIGMRAKVIENAMANYKKFIIEGTGERRLGTLLKMVSHGGVLKAKGFNRNMAQEFSVGGVDAQMLDAYNFDQHRLEQLSGLTETAKGNVNAGATATAESIAAAGASSRTEAMLDEWTDFVREEWLGIAEIVDGDDMFYMPLPPEVQQDGVQAMALQGGRESGESFEDYDLRINPLQLRYRSEADRLAAAEREFALFTTLAQIAPTPGFLVFDWPGVLEDMGAAYRIPDLPKRLNVGAAQQVAALFLQMEIQGAMQPGTARPQARSVADSGVAGRQTVVAASQARQAQQQLGPQGSTGGVGAPGGMSKPGGAKPRAQARPGAKSGASAGAKAKAGAY